MKTSKHTGWMRTALCGMSLMTAALASTGCQITEGGQTLPSAYYVDDDVQYFPPGPEFKLTKEAAASGSRPRRRGPPQRGTVASEGRVASNSPAN